MSTTVSVQNVPEVNNSEAIASEPMTDRTQVVGTIYLIGAFDRHNYGDILFAMVHSQFVRAQLGQDKKVEIVSVSSSDMSECGGFKTLALKTVLQRTLSNQDRIVLCGGDILSADWMLMFAHLAPSVFIKPARVARKLLGITKTNAVLKRLMGEENEFPYIVSASHTDAPIYYTSVGGAGFPAGESRHFDKVVEQLRSAAVVSVRDTSIFDRLSSAGLDVQCTPDTALVMSDFYPPNMLAERPWAAHVRTSNGFDFDRYYSFQGAKRLIKGALDSLETEIKNVFEKTGFAPLLVPIGRAPDHEDHIPLELLYQRLTTAGVPCGLLDSEHVLDIMAALAFAKTYVGTSLHGAITTYSFGKRPCALFSGQVKKLEDFLSTWLPRDEFRLFDDVSFSDELILLLNEGGELKDTSGLERNKAKVYEVLRQYV
jgi:polysaccharide pyruvyl transferase WcaK-like protein